MLRVAAGKLPGAQLVCGRDVPLPLRQDSVDLIFGINAIHHFSDPHRFVSETALALRPGGALAVVGMDPRRGPEQWYPYRYFTGIYERDLHRFPTWEVMSRWATDAGLAVAPVRAVDRATANFSGAEVFGDPFLEKEACSQLAMLTEEEYATGRRCLAEAVRAADSGGRPLLITTDIVFDLWVAVKPM
jgi:SAM-dependent methyltransferase